MRTLVVSDLHLGAIRRTDVLRRRGPREGLCAGLHDIDRLVVLGDALELRHGPLRDVLAVAGPVLAELAEAVGDGGELVLVTGNHDHHLVAPWLEERALAHGGPPPLGLETEVDLAESPALRTLRDALPARGASLSVRFPGVRLRDDVYALHGHYLDRLITLPSFERLALGVMARVVGPVPEGRASARAEDFEAALQPLYAWMHAVAQSPAGTWSASRQSASAGAWTRLSGEEGAESGLRRAEARRRRLQTATMRAAFPRAVAALNRFGFGPLHSDISGHELRRAGLRAITEVVWRLGIEADHVVFGHTHRAGPLPRDPAGEWTLAATGTRLHNSGCWVDEPVFATGGAESPYWAGRAMLLEDEGPPRLVRLVEDLGSPRDA